MVLLSIKKIFFTFKDFVINIPQYFRLQKRAVIFSIYKTRFRIKNLLQTNMNLVMYHFKNGNIPDTIFRLKIILNFIEKEEQKKVAYYYLGWSYLLRDCNKQNQAAEMFLNAGRHDLEMFIKKITTIEVVKSEFQREYRDIVSSFFYKKFLNKKCVARFLSSVEVFLKEEVKIQQIKSKSSQKYEILDILNSTGKLGYKLRNYLSDIKNLIIDGFDISPKMHEISTLINESHKIYDSNILTNSIENFFSNSNKKYNLVINYFGINYDTSLEHVLSYVYDHLEEGGHFISQIILSNPKNKELNKFDYTTFSFFHSEDFIDKVLQKLKFKIYIRKHILTFYKRKSLLLVLQKI